MHIRLQLAFYAVVSACAACPRDSLAVFFAVRQAERCDHRHVLLDRRAGRREHVARDRGGGTGPKRRGAVLGQQLAARGQADVGCRIDVAEEGNRAQDVSGWQLRASFHARAGDRHERVDRDGLDAELREGNGHVEAVLPGLAHADDAARADAEALFLCHLDGPDAVVVGV